MIFPVIIRVCYPGHKPTDTTVLNKDEFDSTMARARNSSATKIQVFEFSYSLNLQSEWAVSPAQPSSKE